MLKSVKCFFIFAAVISFVQIANAQDMRETLFKELDDLLQNAKEINAELLSPSYFENGLEYYNDADQMMKSGDNTDDIKESIEKGIEQIKKAIEISTLVKEKFAKLIEARNDAEAAHAPEAAKDLWEYGVESFSSATEEFESGYIKDAQELATESEKYFRDAELKAIKLKLLGPTWDLIEKAEELSVIDYAPVTLSKSKLLLQQAESELGDNRYNNTHAKELIAESFYEAKHAIYMAKLFMEMIDKDKTWEDIKLASEEPLKEIANKLSLTARFDKGYDETKNGILNHIINNTSLTDTLYRKITFLQTKNIELENKTSELTANLEKLNQEKSVIEKQLEKIELEKEVFNNVQSLFSMSEAEVIKDAGNIVIRLNSLNFDAGKSIIDPQYFSLLSKVQKAISMFPDCTVSVEGHTDSRGNEEANLNLSQERADAVKQYLLANLDINSNKILAIGYGETKPISNNETEDGRRNNRRIDVVIHPLIMD